MPTPRVVLHIGMHKTGTTLIQRILNENQELLASAGVLHARTGIPRGHNNAHRGLMLAVRKHDDGQWEQLADEISGSGLPTAVLDAEEFIRCDQPQVSLVAQKLERFDTQVVVYVRNERDFMLAACRQQWKDGSWGGTFAEFVRAKIQRCNYAEHVGRWVEAFGPEHVSVALYDKAVSGPGLIEDFVSRLGLSPEVEPVVLTALERPRKPLNASSDDAVAMTQRSLTALEARLPDRLTPTDAFQRLRRSVRKQGAVGRGAVALVRPQGPVYAEADVDWLRERTAKWHHRFLDRFVDPADHHYLDF